MKRENWVNTEQEFELKQIKPITEHRMETSFASFQVNNSHPISESIILTGFVLPAACSTFKTLLVSDCRAIDSIPGPYTWIGKIPFFLKDRNFLPYISLFSVFNIIGFIILIFCRPYITQIWMNIPITCYYSINDYGDKIMLVPMKVDYGVRILVHLASLEPDTIVKATEISKKRHIPEKFLFQISNELIEKKFIKSLRGPNGGYSLAKNPSEISIADIKIGRAHV